MGEILVEVRYVRLVFDRIVECNNTFPQVIVGQVKLLRVSRPATMRDFNLVPILELHNRQEKNLDLRGVGLATNYNEATNSNEGY